jgi:hypothetical protein
MNYVYVVNVASGNVGEESEDFRAVSGLVFLGQRCEACPDNLHNVRGKSAFVASSDGSSSAAP